MAAVCITMSLRYRTVLGIFLFINSKLRCYSRTAASSEMDKWRKLEHKMFLCSVTYTWFYLVTQLKSFKYKRDCLSTVELCWAFSAVVFRRLTAMYLQICCNCYTHQHNHYIHHKLHSFAELLCSFFLKLVGQ
jgi:hypothetical protein